MAKRVKKASKKAPRIVDTGPKQPLVDVKTIAKALSAEIIGHIEGFVHSKPQFAKNRKFRWIIWVSGIRMYEFNGTEKEAEEQRCWEARHEMCISKKFNTGFTPNYDMRDGKWGSDYLLIE